MSSYDHWVSEFESRKWKNQRKKRPALPLDASSPGLPDPTKAGGPGRHIGKCSPLTSFRASNSPTRRTSSPPPPDLALSLTLGSQPPPSRPHHHHHGSSSPRISHAHMSHSSTMSTSPKHSGGSPTSVDPPTFFSSSESRRRMGGSGAPKARLPGDKQTAPEIQYHQAQPTNGIPMWQLWQQTMPTSPSSSSSVPMLVPAQLVDRAPSPQLGSISSGRSYLVGTPPPASHSFVIGPSPSSYTAYESTTPSEPIPPSPQKRPQSPVRRSMSPSSHFLNSSPTFASMASSDYNSSYGRSGSPYRSPKLAIVPAAYSVSTFDEPPFRSPSPPPSMFPSGGREALPQPSDRAPPRAYSPGAYRSTSPLVSEMAVEASLAVAGSPLRRQKTWEDNGSIARAWN
eukprot:TRINITY_DN32718_c0_g1_i1.p1 TRINITY_DN32718_c0_g1~~TRINITY_DN32718_c0_g1_i1.p1  ORF type:complete len:398 (+),score=24.11 TRINITY_DN32718_c0_g1_i1:150-1343(+)